MASEGTPLLHASAPPGVWKACTHYRHARYLLLLLICCIPLGGHFVKNSISSLEPFILEDSVFPVNNSMYGALMSAVTIPGMIMPVLGGLVLDHRGNNFLLAFLMLMLVGHILFTVAMANQRFMLAVVGRFIFGLGEGCAVVGARVMVSNFFERWEFTFAMGATVAVTAVSKILARATVAPVALALGGYVYALWYGAFICLVSVLACVATLFLTHELKQQQLLDRGAAPTVVIESVERPLPQSPKELSSCDLIKQLDSRFWLVAILHMVFINTFHPFQNVASSYLHQRYGYTVVQAGRVSSLSSSFVLFAPLIGLWAQRETQRLVIIIASALLSVVSYAVLLHTSVSPIVVMVLMSACMCFTPAALMASVPLAVPSHCWGVAFGVMEILDSFASTCMNLFVGWVRDVTGSYQADLYFMSGLAYVSLGLSLVLFWMWDSEVETTDAAIESVFESDVSFRTAAQRQSISILGYQSACSSLGPFMNIVQRRDAKREEVIPHTLPEAAESRLKDHLMFLSLPERHRVPEPVSDDEEEKLPAHLEALPTELKEYLQGECSCEMDSLGLLDDSSFDEDEAARQLAQRDAIRKLDLAQASEALCLLRVPVMPGEACTCLADLRRRRILICALELRRANSQHKYGHLGPNPADRHSHSQALDRLQSPMELAIDADGHMFVQSFSSDHSMMFAMSPDGENDDFPIFPPETELWAQEGRGQLDLHGHPNTLQVPSKKRR
eukprot:gb/GEZN01002517.1/.p1 GENE.gb/GEZN01002517.1/~~gb/GEZN01002517.1/.p1  ORF type:complete len:729 (-),score=80.89 gb/GEZN01002517.1/:239-2425(-)